MKNVFKALAVTACSMALCAGVATATACSGTNGEYIGYYCYANEYNAVYGIIAKVTVKNNIIEKVEDITHSYGDGEAYSCTYTPIVIDWAQGGPQRDEQGDWLYGTESKTVYNKDWHTVSAPGSGWSKEQMLTWLNYENWLLQQYVGWSVADVLAIPVYYDELGEVYGSSYNPEFVESGLLISESTQGSGRVLLAVQNALGK